MVGPRGKVIGVDHIPQLVEMSVKNVKKNNKKMLETGQLQLFGEYECEMAFAEDKLSQEQVVSTSTWSPHMSSVKTEMRAVNENNSILVGDGRDGWPADAPYDAIHVGAAAEKLPTKLIDQLKPGGRLVSTVYFDSATFMTYLFFKIQIPSRNLIIHIL